MFEEVEVEVREEKGIADFFFSRREGMAAAGATNFRTHHV